MLPSKERLSRADFVDLLNGSGLSVYNTFGTVKYKKSLLNKGFSVVLSKKHQKRAVKRNLLKRQIYSVIRLFLAQNPQFPTISGAFYLSKKAYTMSYIELKDYIYELLTKIQKNT